MVLPASIILLAGSIQLATYPAGSLMPAHVYSSVLERALFVAQGLPSCPHAAGRYFLLSCYFMLHKAQLYSRASCTEVVLHMAAPLASRAA